MVISKGNSRKTKSWHKVEISWERFLDKLKNPIRTKETQAEYFKMSKSQQDDIKDVGGFVGGELLNGQRKANTVVNRWLLTLDADYASIDFCDYIEMFFNFTYCIYSTHKHTSNKPRYRLLIPLNKACNPEEYEAISRLIANDIGIDFFDDTTYQPHRLMYYPSVSKDGEYVFKHRTSVCLDVDNTLSRYEDWRDRSSWAVSSRATKVISSGVKKQQDPTTKDGIIGAFCRFYDIHGVIDKYLNDVYVPCDGVDRYTYTKGSTYGGLLVYDNGLFSYSNHATDPTTGRLCNAFDLLRIHKFGHLDEDTSSKTNTEYRPSFKAALDLLAKDEDVQRALLKSKLDDARHDFKILNITKRLKLINIYIKFGYKVTEHTQKVASILKKLCSKGALRREKYAPLKKCMLSKHARGYIFVIRKCGLQSIVKKYARDFKEHVFRDEHTQNDWLSELKFNSKGVILQTSENASLVMQNDIKLKDKFAYDEFTNKIWVLGELPWNRSKKKRQWRDVDDAGLRNYLETTYKLNNRLKIYDAWGLTCEKNRFNPVKDYLNGLKWDGIKRLDTLFIDYLGVADNTYTREATRKSLVGAVARVFEPGIKLDTSIVLVGSQGVGKSQIVHRLGKEWFSDSLHTVKGKEACEQIQGFWIIEIAELAAMKKAEVEAIKHFMSRREDSYRGAYARNVETHKRQCIFICTTNTHDFLRDVTGGRRFFPMDVSKERATKDIWRDFNAYEVDQLWAEAVVLYKDGEELILSEEARELAVTEQEAHSEYNPYEGIINEYLDMPVPEDWYEKDLYERINYINGEDKVGKPRDKISVLEVWCEALGGVRKDLTLQKSREIANLIIKNGSWVKTATIKTGHLYGTQRGFKKVNGGKQ